MKTSLVNHYSYYQGKSRFISSEVFEGTELKRTELSHSITPWSSFSTIKNIGDYRICYRKSGITIFKNIADSVCYDEYNEISSGMPDLESMTENDQISALKIILDKTSKRRRWYYIMEKSKIDSLFIEESYIAYDY